MVEKITSLALGYKDNHLKKVRDFDDGSSNGHVLLIKFEYLYELSKNVATGKEIHEFLTSNNLLNTGEKVLLDKYCQRCTPYSLYVNRIQAKLNDEARSEMPFKDKFIEFFQVTNQEINYGSVFGWIIILIICASIATCVNDSQSDYNHPACAKLGLKSNWNNTKCY